MYKQATVKRLDIPNRLDREFDVEQLNQVWCGDITFNGGLAPAVAEEKLKTVSGIS